MARRRTVYPTRDCARCGLPAENAAPGAGEVADARGRRRKADNFVVCFLCQEVARMDPERYWRTGWPGMKE